MKGFDYMNVLEKIEPLLVLIEQSPEATEATAKLKAKINTIIVDELHKVSDKVGISYSSLTGYIVGAVGIVAVVLDKLHLI
jgi:hypothetical protein